MEIKPETIAKSNEIKKLLNEYEKFSSVIPEAFLDRPPYLLDLTINNSELAVLDMNNQDEFEKYIDELISKSGSRYAIGGYGEDRVIYKRSGLFENSTESRTIHLGTDVWMPANTPVYSPLPARVHSFQDNNNFGDYGPTIILEHSLQDKVFYTLYGHLSRTSLTGLKEGMNIEAGQQIATLGEYSENGNWPAHLHFQIITDMLGRKGDFPGVVRIDNKEYFMILCPDPELILRTPQNQLSSP